MKKIIMIGCIIVFSLSSGEHEAEDRKEVII